MPRILLIFHEILISHFFLLVFFKSISSQQKDSQNQKWYDFIKNFAIYKKKKNKPLINTVSFPIVFL